MRVLGAWMGGWEVKTAVKLTVWEWREVGLDLLGHSGMV